MHEYSIAVSIINSVLKIAEERHLQIEKVFVVAGVLKAVMPDALMFSFDALKIRNPLIADAELVLKTILLRGECNNCGKKFEIERPSGICPHCGSADVIWTGGNELFVEKIEVRSDNRRKNEARTNSDDS